ncbi:MAG TPA: hypothetical protein VFK50_07270 [Sphingomicrobium sp.]|nr:hypothetical protein [Sphingomicrobium sp.]
MTAMWLVIGCMAFMIVAGGARGRGGVAFADVTLLVMLLALIAVVNLLLSRFVYTGDIGWTIAGLLAFGFALDALYGLMAPQRKRQRDRKLRALMQRRRRA